MRAKQKCEGAAFARVEKPAASEPVVAALGEIVKVLVGIRCDLRHLANTVGDRWIGADDDEFDPEYSDEEEEAAGELPDLVREADEYREFIIRRRWEIENAGEDDESESGKGSEKGSEKGESEAGEDAKSAGSGDEGAGPSGSAGVAP